MTERAERVRSEIRALGAECFLVTNPVNLLYLTGLQSSNAACLIRPDAILLLTDGRYIEAARSVPDVEAVEASRDLIGWLGGRLGELATSPLAFEADHVTVAQHEPLRESGLELVPTTALVKRVRAVKSPEELERIRASAAVNDAMIRRLAEERLIGRTETEVAWWIVQALGEEGADGVALTRSSAPARTQRSRTTIRATADSAATTPSSSTRVRFSTTTAPTARGRSRLARCRGGWQTRTSSADTLRRMLSRRSAPLPTRGRSTRARAPRSSRPESHPSSMVSAMDSGSTYTSCRFSRRPTTTN